MNSARPQRLVRYLAACVEAEHAATELVPLDAAPGGAEPALLLERGTVPLGDATHELALSNRARRWADIRQAATAEETLWVGWPVVRGHRRVGGRRIEVVTGLLIGQASLTDEGDGDGPGSRSVLTPRRPSVALGDAALDLLGYPADERHLLRRDFDRALNRGRGDTFAAAARFLNARGITTASYDPRDLGPLDQAQPLSNTAVAWVGQAADAPSTRWVIEDLDALGAVAGEPGTLPAPLTLVLTEDDDDTIGPAAGPPPLDPVPGIAPLDLHQEAAIAAALHRPLSVVTAPAGLARTAFVANTVAAAVAAGEKVLVASTNERALDLIHDHLDAANEWATPVRAGVDPQRPAVADTLDRAVRAKIDPNRAERYPTWWAVRADIEPPYRSLAQRRELTWRLEQLTRRAAAIEQALPSGVEARGDAGALASAIPSARARATEWQAVPRRRPWHKPRARVTERALDQALGEVFSALDGPVRELVRLRHDSGDPAGAIELAAAVLDALEATNEMGDVVSQLAKLPDEGTVDAQIEETYPTRRVAAAQLHEDRWADLLDVDARLRSVVQLYRAGLVAPTSGTEPDEAAADATRAELHRLLPDVLAMLPVWVVSTPAVGQWFPPIADLFDLVIVDDAGQGDIASALPVLARARRAVVIGDAQQLSPVTHVTTDLDAQLAGDHDLPEDDHRHFSPRRASLLSLALRAAGGATTFLPMVAGVDPELVGLISSQWYGDRLLTRNGQGPLPGPAVRWVDHRGQFDTGRGGRSGRNASEALAVVDEVVAQLAELRTLDADDEDALTFASHDETDPPDDEEHEDESTDESRRGGLDGAPLDLPRPSVRSIGIITPLVAQRDALSDLLLERFGRAITVDTPDTFQGDERDIIIVSLAIGEDTRRELVELVADDARLNVTLSRARARLLIIGDRAVAEGSETLLADIARRVPGH
jgi:hypothetical protein